MIHNSLTLIVLMIRIRWDEPTARQHGADPRSGDRTLPVFQRLNGKWISLSKRGGVKTKLTSTAQNYLRTHLMGMG
jgi:hypothetical protein